MYCLYHVKKPHLFSTRKTTNLAKMMSCSVLCFFKSWCCWKLEYKKLLTTLASEKCLTSPSCTTKLWPSAWPSWQWRWTSFARCCATPLVSSHICLPRCASLCAKNVVRLEEHGEVITREEARHVQWLCVCSSASLFLLFSSSGCRGQQCDKTCFHS